MIRVVAAVIVNHENEVLIARKRKGKSNAGLWEFPGGKVEEEETDAQALVREVQEELRLEVQVVHLIQTVKFHIQDTKSLLLAYKCVYISGKPIVIDHDRIAWVELAGLRGYSFPETNQPIVDSLVGV